MTRRYLPALLLAAAALGGCASTGLDEIAAEVADDLAAKGVLRSGSARPR